MQQDLNVVKAALAGVAPLSGPDMLRGAAIICYLTAAADGDVSIEELDRIAQTLAALTNSADTWRVVEDLITAVAREIEARGQDNVIRQLAARILDPEQRRTAFSYAAAVAYADGILEFAEEVLLIHLADAFGIPEAEAEQILDRFRNRA